MAADADAGSNSVRAFLDSCEKEKRNRASNDNSQGKGQEGSCFFSPRWWNSRRVPERERTRVSTAWPARQAQGTRHSEVAHKVSQAPDRLSRVCHKAVQMRFFRSPIRFGLSDCSLLCNGDPDGVNLEFTASAPLLLLLVQCCAVHCCWSPNSKASRGCIVFAFFFILFLFFPERNIRSRHFVSICMLSDKNIRGAESCGSEVLTSKHVRVRVRVGLATRLTVHTAAAAAGSNRPMRPCKFMRCTAGTKEVLCFGHPAR